MRNTDLYFEKKYALVSVHEGQCENNWAEIIHGCESTFLWDQNNTRSFPCHTLNTALKMCAIWSAKVFKTLNRIISGPAALVGLVRQNVCCTSSSSVQGCCSFSYVLVSSKVLPFCSHSCEKSRVKTIIKSTQFICKFTSFSC